MQLISAWSPRTLLILWLTVIGAQELLFDYEDPATAEAVTSYRSVVNQILQYITEGEGKGQAYDRLAKLCDLYGARFPGTKQLEVAIDYLMQEMIDEGLYDAVYTEDVDIIGWTRLTEKATLLEPVIDLGDEIILRDIALYGSGYSVSTVNPGTGEPGPIEADVIVVKDLDELYLLGDPNTGSGNEIEGKIVVFNKFWDGYESTYRRTAPIDASKLGAVATLTRSLGDLSIYSPRTGTVRFDLEPEVEEIPAACITTEDTDMLQRFQDQGQRIRISVDVRYQRVEGLVSRNLIAEIAGADPDVGHEVVIFGAHTDTWDLAAGAMDDGGGVVITWQAMTTLAKLGLRPRRTLRAVLWTAEEVADSPGGVEYFERHKVDIDDVVIVMESDYGTFDPLGLEYTGGTLGAAILEDVLQGLAPIGATQVVGGAFGYDIEPWQNENVSSISLLNANADYFHYHHTLGDTISVENPESLDGCSVTWTVGAFLAADYYDRNVWYDYSEPQRIG